MCFDNSNFEVMTEFSVNRDKRLAKLIELSEVVLKTGNARGYIRNNREFIASVVPSDFIFLYSHDPFDLQRALPQGFWVEKTSRGTLAWNYDIPTDYLEKCLVHLGPVLLG